MNNNKPKIKYELLSVHFSDAYDYPEIKLGIDAREDDEYSPHLTVTIEASVRYGTPYIKAQFDPNPHCFKLQLKSLRAIHQRALKAVQDYNGVNLHTASLAMRFYECFDVPSGKRHGDIVKTRNEIVAQVNRANDWERNHREKFAAKELEYREQRKRAEEEAANEAETSE